MQRNDATRTALLPSANRGVPGRRNEDLLRLAGLSGDEIEKLSACAAAECVDSVVLFCRERQIDTLDKVILPVGERLPR